MVTKNLIRLASLAVAWRVAAVIEQERRAIMVAKARHSHEDLDSYAVKPPPPTSSRRSEPATILLIIVGLAWLATAIAVVRPVAGIAAASALVGLLLLVVAWLVFRRE
jgi:hypothetical protein